MSKCEVDNVLGASVIAGIVVVGNANMFWLMHKGLCLDVAGHWPRHTCICMDELELARAS